MFAPGLDTPILKLSPDATGSKDAKTGILIVYDIFGFFPQTLQGADILAYTDKEQQYQVFMPDFFEGSPADISWYPPDNKEKEEKLGKFFQTAAAPPKTLPRIPRLLMSLARARASRSGPLSVSAGAERLSTCPRRRTPSSRPRPPATQLWLRRMMRPELLSLTSCCHPVT